MSVTNLHASANPSFLADAVAQLETFIQQAARDGGSLHDVERRTLDSLLAIGHR